MNLLTLQWGPVITKHEFTPTAGYTDYLLGHPDGGASWKRNVITTIQAGEPKRPLTCRPTTISPHTNVVRVDGGKLPVALQPCPSSSFAQWWRFFLKICPAAAFVVWWPDRIYADCGRLVVQHLEEKKRVLKPLKKKKKKGAAESVKLFSPPSAFNVTIRLLFFRVGQPIKTPPPPPPPPPPSGLKILFQLNIYI